MESFEKLLGNTQHWSALPVPLLRQVHFCVFLCVFFKGAFLGAPWSALRSLWAPAGAKSEHFRCQMVAKKCQKTVILQNQGKLIWSGKYHTILRVGPLKKALKTFKNVLKTVMLSIAAF